MPLFQFKSIVSLALVLFLSLALYVIYSISALYRGDARAEAEKLVKYGARVLSRYRANPEAFVEATLPSGIPLGGQRYHVVLDYAALKKNFPRLPAQTSLPRDKVVAFDFSFTSILRVPNYTLVLPISLANDEFAFAYKAVYRDDGTISVNLRVLEVIQPALALALVCVFSLVLVGMFHISRVHTGVRLFQEWAERIKSGAATAPPSFPSSKLNYIAFAINNSLVGVAEALEKEQDFAAFSSHELRAPVAILAANLEMLEYIKKDLSPQEQTLIKNMDSAIADMKCYMESFLWLASEKHERNQTRFNARDVVVKSLKENAELFAGARVEVEDRLEDYEIFTEESLFYVLVNNVLRNAFQHTVAGKITLTLHDGRLNVCNQLEVGETLGDNSGFGVGTKIIERLTVRLGIRCEVIHSDHGRRVTLVLTRAHMD